MGDYDRRNGGNRGGYNNRKRRYRGEDSRSALCSVVGADQSLEDDDNDRRPQRRRYEEPTHVKVRKQLLGIAESVWMARL